MLPRSADLPFGAGPHVCIGNHVAMMEAQLVLATLVQSVTFALVPGQTIAPEPLITLRPKGGIRVVVRRR
jgi:cytochrome P450